MMRKTFFLICAVCLLGGCGKSTSDARSSDEFKMNLQTSQELAEIDADLDTLQAETDNLKDSYQQIQSTLLPHIKLESEDQQATQLVVYINENSVLIVNDTPMSKNDFTQFADKNLPKLCIPTPRLSIHSKAIYDTAAWVLDTIYSHGCSNVSIE